MATYTFTPPTVYDVPAVDADMRGPRYRLFRHYGPRARGENVWELLDGSMTLVQPFPTVSVVDAETQTSDAPATYRKVFYGGHVYEGVTEVEAAALQAAGFAQFGVNLVVEADDPHALLTSDGFWLFLAGSNEVLEFV